MENKIKHLGVVQSVDEHCVKVRIVQSSACASCKISRQCNSAERKEKIVDVYLEESGFKPGDEVTVLASYGIGLYAVSFGLLLPMFAVVVVLFVMLALGCGELLSSLCSLASLMIYYLLLFAFHKKIDSKVNFQIERT